MECLPFRCTSGVHLQINYRGSWSSLLRTNAGWVSCKSADPVWFFGRRETAARSCAAAYLRFSVLPNLHHSGIVSDSLFPPRIENKN